MLTFLTGLVLFYSSSGLHCGTRGRSDSAERGEYKTKKAAGKTLSKSSSGSLFSFNHVYYGELLYQCLSFHCRPFEDRA